MNLIRDSWLTFRFKDGSEQILPLATISNPDVIDFVLPRADFYGAIYQFSIGLLQTVFAPRNIDDWLDYYDKPPSLEKLQEAFDKAEHAFNITGNAPLFMQDFDELKDSKSTPISSLLIEAPGANTLKHNTDHFIKRGMGAVMSLEMAALALFTLQINAPGGGQGHRAGLRGGGPLTTLLQLNDVDSSLWHKLWLNVINLEKAGFQPADLHSANVFPWLEQTKTSKNLGSEVYAHDVHPLHMYWAMPRRIRLSIEDQEEICQITGNAIKQCVTSYRTKNNGYNYSGTWTHPLTPYKWDPKEPDADHLSLKGQPSGITYKTWANLTLTDSKEGQCVATVVDNYYQLAEELPDKLTAIPQLWVFGFDLDNMKARSWYSVTMPIFQIEISKQNALLVEVKTLQQLAIDALKICHTQIKAAWFDRPKNVKGDMSFIDIEFWQRTEAEFYKIIAELFKNSTEVLLAPEHVYLWLKTIRICAMNLFDQYVLSEHANARSMTKCIKARKTLTNWLYTSKNIKAFQQAYNLLPSKEIN